MHQFLRMAVNSPKPKFAIFDQELWVVAYAERFPDHIVERARAQIAAFTSASAKAKRGRAKSVSTP